MCMCMIRPSKKLHQHGMACMHATSAQALCCGCYAAMATRWMLQDQVQLRNAWPDECMAGTTLCLRGCLAGLGCDASNNRRPCG